VPKRHSNQTRPKLLSKAAAYRLSLYLRCMNTPTISSVQLAKAIGVSDAQVRRDLAAVGHLGKRGIGYDSTSLAVAIRKTLGLDHVWRAVIVGVGNLARALLRYQGFREQGFEIVGLFDSDPAKIGTKVEFLTVEPVDRLTERLPTLHAELGILTVPATYAQQVATLLCSSGIRGILSFTPGVLKVPEHVKIVPVDLTIQLEQLAFLIQANRLKS
jgi:redox-sensing transcriptional repressor